MLKYEADDEASRARQKQIGPEKMKILTLCFELVEQREIVDLVWVATGDRCSFEKKNRFISQKPFSHMTNFQKIVITRAPDHPQA